MIKSYRSLLLLSAIGIVTVAATPGFAQQSAPADAGIETVVVSGTRIVRDGYQAPTPTTVLGEADLDAKAPANIADVVNELPSLAGSATPASSGGGITAGVSGINALNLRSLGPVRTLVLVDGERVGTSTLSGWVDINQFPNQLVKRVDVVTGGASAAYGSDAVAGVVNFVLDKDFTGLKGEVSGGETTYGDGGNYKVALTWGSAFANDRGHVLFSAELNHDDGIVGYPRAWAYNANLLSVNPAYVAGNGQPQYMTGFTGFATATPGGIITSGPAKGVYFGANGTPAQFNYGVVSGNWMIGGQSAYTYNYALGEGDMTPLMDRKNVYFRSSYDVTDHLQVFAQASFATTKTSQNGLAPPTLSYFTVSPTNAYLPASVAAVTTSSFTLGSFLQDTGAVAETTSRSAARFVLGVSGDFDALGSNWNWDGHAQTSINTADIYARELNLANLTAGINAVKNPLTGAIQCASIATNPGCVPFDLFGVGVNSPAAVNYVIGTAIGHTKLTENEIAVNLRGEPISDWAGPISVATGIEHRSEAVTGSNDPISTVNGWRAGNQHASHGFFDVTEGYVEVVVPLLKDVPFAKSLDFNGAARETGYSLSGLVTTWKVGLTWSPIDDLTFRATHSIDIRAPSLADLFTGGTGTVSTGLTDAITHTVTGSVTTVAQGTTNLTPEVANSNGAGIVLTPSFLPGFQASVDYYTVDIDNAIYSASAQNLINECAQGLSQACASIIRNGAGVIVQVNAVPINIAQQVNRGLDVEASYRREVTFSPLLLDGTFTARFLGTNYFENKLNNSITVPTNNVGQNADNGEGGPSGSLPKWKGQVDLGWQQGLLGLGFTARAISAGKFNTAYVQCTAACPLSTTANPTINNNHIPGAIYFDANASYDLPYGVEAFVVVKNILDTDPVSTPFGPSYGTDQAPASPGQYDILGRTFRAGLRFKM